jgi:Ca2+/Na+ antiporter
LVSTSLEKVSENSKLSSGFIGGVMLSICTSLPESVNSISFGLKNKPEDDFLTILGANSITLFVIGITGVYIYTKFYYKFFKNKNHTSFSFLNCIRSDKSNFMLISFSFITYFFLTFFMLIPSVARYTYIPGLRVSLVSFLPVFLYAYFFYYSFKNSKNDPENILKNIDKKIFKKELTKFFIFALLLIISAYFANATIELFPEKVGLSKTSSVGILLALAGTLPEITTFIFLIKKKQYNMAVSGLVGSHLFNLCIMFTTDAFSTQDPYGSFNTLTDGLYSGSRNNLLFSYLIHTIMYFIFSLFLLKKVSESYAYTYIISIALLFLYITFSILSTFII